MRHPLLRILALIATAAVLAGCGRKPAPAAARGGPRIVSLAPNLTEIVCAVGAAEILAGRSSACDYPPEVVKRVPAVGGFGAPSLERLVAVRPTLVLYTDLADKTMPGAFAELGLPAMEVPCRRLDEVPAAILAVGRATRHEEAAAGLAAALTEQIARLREQMPPAAERPSVFVEIWGDPLITVGRTSFVSELVALAGGRNIGDASEKDYFETSAEWVVSRDPEIILCLYMAENRSVRHLVLSRAGWQEVAALKAGRVYDGLPNSVLLRPGPRVLEGVAALETCIGARR
ncbi:MAG: ABC transporter substrate-binding protein [Kiritimatiellae bacterium]|nr:ABC transporter substrate-binding protein [Kiritimatiellia bacterium]